MLLTLDSSVLVAALRSQESAHGACRRILEQLGDSQHLAVQPFTVLIEVVAAIRRRAGSADLAARVHRDLRSLSALWFVELDSHRADAAVGIARASGVRGMDAIVVQVAKEFGSLLLSLDDEMVARVKDLVVTRAVSTL